jgi:hypothetical protein
LSSGVAIRYGALPLHVTPRFTGSGIDVPEPVIAGEGSAGGKFVPKCGTAARLELALRAPAGQSSLEKQCGFSRLAGIL